MSAEAKKLLNAAAALELSTYRPGVVVAATNAMIPLGKEIALQHIESCLTNHNHLNEPAQGLLWVLRTLFDMPSHIGRHPVLRLGGVAAEPKVPEEMPRFPLALIDDCPLLMIRGYVLGGVAEPVEIQLEQYRAAGVIRTEPLVPVPSPDLVLKHFASNYQRAYGTLLPADIESLIKSQLRP